MRLDLGDSLLMFHITEDKPRRVIDAHYTWYTYNELHRTRLGFNGYLLEGNYESFYPGHHLKSKGEYKLGLKSDTWTYYNRRGNIIQIEEYDQGRLQGERRSYDNGILQSSAEFKNGLKHGVEKTYKADTVFMTLAYKNGRVTDTLSNDHWKNRLPWSR